MASERRANVEYGAETFVEMLNENDVDYVFINSGTDTFPIQEAVTKFRQTGRRTPEIVLCPDEATAIGAAHGHFMLSRKPQVVLVHVDAGTMQLGGGMHNAQRGRAGMVLCAGRAPLTFEGEMAGGKNMSIHWIQEQLDQHGAMRNFTKWDYEMRRAENAQHIIQRAFQIAASEPGGPVYLTLPREILMDSIDGAVIPPAARHGASTTPAADPAAIEQAARSLADASSPVIITGQAGRNPSTVGALVELAELVGASVASDPTFMNFPTTHPMYEGSSAQGLIKDADVILVVDSDVPWIPAHGKPRPDARIIHIDIDPVKESIPLWLFPSDQLIHADSAKAVPALVEAVRSMLTEADSARIDERFQIVKDRHEAQREQSIQLALRHGQGESITPQWLSYCLNEAIGEDSIVLDECVTNSGTVAEYVKRSQPATYFKSGGSSLGWALGASLGAKLARPDKLVVNTVGDGSFIYGCPTSTLWSADVFNAPFLTVIYNNQVHYAAKRSLQGGYPDGYSEKAQTWIGTDLSPSVEFSMIAQACRAYGEKVESPEQVRPAIDRAIEQVQSGKAAVLDVRIERP